MSSPGRGARSSPNGNVSISFLNCKVNAMEKYLGDLFIIIHFCTRFYNSKRGVKTLEKLSQPKSVQPCCKLLCLQKVKITLNVGTFRKKISPDCFVTA